MPTRYYFLKIFWCKTECWCNYNTSWYSFKISILWNFCNRNFFLRLLIHLLVSIPTIIKTVTVLSALGEGKAIIMEAFDLWLGLDSDVVPADVGLRLQHQHHHHHHHHHHHGCNVTCRAVPGEVEAIIMEINHRLIRRGARWENASQGGDALCGQRLTSDAALWIQITLLHTHHTYPLSQFSTLLSTLERHLHYKTLCLCSFPQQWHPPKNIINIFWTYNPTSNSQYSYMKISNSSLQWLQNILRLLAQYSIRPALILSATFLLKSRHSSEIQPWKWKPSKIWQFIIHLLLIVRLAKYCWFKGISVLRLIVVNWYIVNF